MPLHVSFSASSNTTPAVFFLTGIPGLEAMHRWISIPFSTAFAIALLGNSTLLYVIKTEPSLHKPMFYFLSMLAVTDLVLSLTTVPKMLAIFWFDAQQITFKACLVQMFFLHTFCIMESAVLLAMAFDRYVAVCNPLRYSSILTSSLIVKIGLLALLRASGLMLPLPFLLRRLPYCRSHVISHCYCEHMAVVKLACADTRFNNIYGIFVALFIVGLDLLSIGHSYLRILRTVLSLASKEERLKALGTCLSHICAILVFYTPVVLSSVIHRFGHHVAPHVHILMANLYLLFPPMMNPIVYGVKTKQIRDRVLTAFSRKRL
ncbi:olfactory receptor 52K1-like [Dromaius novaehollandiae]|uniref:olfactory receptor 52K1-like n=1 Tax=Dromaius novaehollandiae TaxID=8790 RepID=UPI00311F2DDE